MDCRLLSLRRASKLLGVSDRTLRRWCKEGVLRPVIIRGRPWLPMRELLELVEGRSNEQTD